MPSRITEPFGSELTSPDLHPVFEKGNSPEGVSVREANTSILTPRLHKVAAFSCSNEVDAINSDRLSPDHGDLFPEFDEFFIVNNSITGSSGEDFTSLGPPAPPVSAKGKTTRRTSNGINNKETFCDKRRRIDDEHLCVAHKGHAEVPNSVAQPGLATELKPHDTNCFPEFDDFLSASDGGVGSAPNTNF